MKGYQPTPDDIALEQLLDEACERFRNAPSTTEKHQVLDEYRELLKQRSAGYRAHLDQVRELVNRGNSDTKITTQTAQKSCAGML